MIVGTTRFASDLVRATGRAGQNLLGRSIVGRVSDDEVAAGNGGDRVMWQLNEDEHT